MAIAQYFCFHYFGTIFTPTVVQIISETNPEEASNFFETYLTRELLSSRIMLFPILLAMQIIVLLKDKLYSSLKLSTKIQEVFGIGVIIVLILGSYTYVSNKLHFINLISQDDVYGIEKSRNDTFGDGMYAPLYNIIYSVRANQLAYKQINQLIEVSSKPHDIRLNSNSQNIILVIGESYNKYHSQLYGYNLETTPNQINRIRNGELFNFTDVVSPWNLTSNAFKLLFSLYSIGDDNDWSSYALFPALFKSAGYTVFFLSSQFAVKNSADTSHFAGGFFINNKTLSDLMFSYRNDNNYQDDGGLLDDYNTLRSNGTSKNLFIFHLVGQHYSYSNRFPKAYTKFTAIDYKDKKLDNDKIEIMANYDNATFYNDYILNEIIKLFEKENSVVIYLADHGEEVFEEDGFAGRRHPVQLTPTIAKYEFGIPFWIWYSDVFAENHSNIIEQTKKSVNRKIMSDDLPHLLLYLGGINCDEYQSDHNIIDSTYHESRPRLLRGNEDYDMLISSSPHL